MFNSTKIKGVEYFYTMNKDAAQAQGLSPHEIDNEGNRRDYVDYLADNGAGEEPGRWLVLKSSAASSLPTLSPFATLQDGGAVSGRVLRDLSAGKDPTTGVIIANRKRLKEGEPPKDPGGYDNQISLVKSVSLLKAFGSEDQKARLTEIEEAAYRKTMQWAMDQGLFVTRINKELIPAAEVITAMFSHSTSRAEDPQSHIHGATMKMCVGADGQIRQLDNYLLKKYGGAIAAYHRAEIAKGVREMGYAVERDGRNFQIAGFPPAILELFSKRRADIEKLAKEKGFDTAQARQAAQVASFETRADKAFRPLAELEARWDRELAAKGWSREAILHGLEVAARLAEEKRRADLVGDLVTDQAEGEEAAAPVEESPEDRQKRLNGLVMEAIEAIQQNDAVFTRAMFYKEAFEALQCEAGADEAMAIVSGLEASGVIKQIASPEGQPLYTTAAMEEMEQAILRTAYTRRAEREFVPQAIIDRTIAKAKAQLAEQKRALTDEQEGAIRHALKNDGVSVIQGAAGTGKSFSTRVSKTALEAAGYEVLGLAPSWKAADVLRQDAGLEDDKAMALAKFLAGVRSNKIEITNKTAIVLDEAGMVGHREMKALMDIAAAKGCKLILQGDVQQYRAVAAGAPMAAMQKLIGSAKLGNIQRQRGRSEAEAEWMRAASVDLSTGDPNRIGRALRSYDEVGAITWAKDSDAAIARAVESYMAHLRERPTETRTILTQWNSDARRLNERLREQLREAGFLSRESVDIAVIPRGAKEGAKPITLDFSEGDELIFGENVLVDGTMIRNADIGRLVRIDATDPANPVLTVELRKGATVTGTVRDFIGSRPDPEEGEEPAPTGPKFQHAYAMTGHASQGASLNKAIDLRLQQNGANGSYVCATRHINELEIIVDCERIADKIGAKAPASFAVGGGAAAGQMKTAEEGEHNEEPSDEDIRAEFIAECCGKDPIGNVSDHIKNVREWLGIEPAAKPVVANQEAPKVAETLAPRFRRIPGQADPIHAQAAKPRPAEELAARIETNRKHPAPQPKRIGQEEWDDFARRDLAAYAEAHGFEAEGKWMPSRDRAMDYRMYYQPGGGGKIAISRWHDGTWGFYKADGTAKGRIWHFEGWRTGKAPGVAAHALRSYFRTSPATPSPIDATRRAERAATPPANGLKALADEAERKRQHDYLMGRIRRNWHTMSSAVNEYLVKVRGIAPAILERFRADIRTERAGKYSVEGVACFAHRDLSGAIVGYERKGEGWQDGGRRAFSQMAAGSDKRFTMMGDTEAPRRIYVAESSVDGLSIYQHDHQPERALIVSPYGNPSAVALGEFRKLIERHPESEVHVAMDNDADGRRFAELFEAEVKAARGPQAGVVDRRPGDQFKDWNDQIRGITREMAAKAKAERQAAEEKARRDAEAKAREEAQKRAYRPGPRM